MNCLLLAAVILLLWYNGIEQQFGDNVWTVLMTGVSAVQCLHASLVFGAILTSFHWFLLQLVVIHYGCKNFVLLCVHRRRYWVCWVCWSIATWSRICWVYPTTSEFHCHIYMCFFLWCNGAQTSSSQTVQGFNQPSGMILLACTGVATSHLSSRVSSNLIRSPFQPKML